MEKGLITSMMKSLPKAYDSFKTNLAVSSKMKTLSFELVPGQSHLVSHYEGLPDMTIDRQGNSLNIEFDSSRYQSADIIKQTLSDFEIRDLKMLDTDIEDIIRRFYRKEL